MHHSLSILCLQLLLAAGMTAADSPACCQKPKPPSGPTEDGCRKAPGVVQLEAGSAVARFMTAGSCLEVRGHGLQIDFLGTPGARPRILTEDGAPRAVGAFARKVVYGDLWPGIKVIFGLNPEGRAEITYELAKGADVSRIRLHYSVAVEIREDGTLRFIFPAGPVAEPSPEAWQVIDGQPQRVRVAFTELSGGAIGFKLGNYDPRYPLTIDPAY